MQSTLKTYACMTIVAAATLAAGLIAASPAVPVAVASGAMPVAQQNALVQTYCAVCHTDASMNGGLSLQHFDAAHPNPGVAAMLLSKLTNGISPAQVEASHRDPAVAALIADKMKGGAMGAAGVPVPDRPTQNALLDALAAQSAGAGAWTLDRTQYPSAQSPVVTASILQQVSSTAYPGDTDMYRLTLSCNADTHAAEMQVAWAPGVPPTGREMSVAVDGKPPFTYKVEGSEKMGNGTATESGPGAAKLAVTSLPAKALVVSNLFPDETVVFRFDSLPETMRKTLSTCFTAGSARR